MTIIDQVALAHEVAAELGEGWSVSEGFSFLEFGPSGELHGPDGIIIDMFQVSDARLVLIHDIPSELSQYNRHDSPPPRRIVIPATKTPEEIARDIRNRMLEDCREHLEDLREEKERWQDRRRKIERNRRLILEAAPKGWAWSPPGKGKKVEVWLNMLKDHPVHARMIVGEEIVQFKEMDLPIEDAIAFMAWLKERYS